MIPDAYSNIYKGWPWEKREEKSINVSEPERPKLENVMGSNSNAEAKIAGITPAVFIFKGKCEDSPPYIFVPICLFG